MEVALRKDWSWHLLNNWYRARCRFTTSVREMRVVGESVSSQKTFLKSNRCSINLFFICFCWRKWKKPIAGRGDLVKRLSSESATDLVKDIISFPRPPPFLTSLFFIVIIVELQIETFTNQVYEINIKAWLDSDPKTFLLISSFEYLRRTQVHMVHH
jgi:hypothetical protein